MLKKIVGVFEDRGAAMAAREDLTMNGFASADIDVVEQPRGGKANVGMWEKLKDFFRGGEHDIYQEAARRGGILLAVSTDEGRQDLAEDILNRHGPVDVDQKAGEWRAQGWNPPAPTIGGGETIPIAEEQLRVGKRSLRGGGVRIHTHVSEHPVEETVTLRQEEVSVGRQRVDRPAGPDVFKEQSIELTETHEEPVVSKQAHVVEEITVGKEVTEKKETIRDTLRKTEVDIEQLDREYLSDFQERGLGTSGGRAYDDLRPGYQLGRQLALSPEFEGQPWSTVEGRARQYCDRSLPGQWPQLQQAIRFGYENELKRK